MRYILFILSLFLLSNLTFGDSNGIWLEAKDIRGGIFAQDENNKDFSFIGLVNFNDIVNFNQRVNLNIDTVYKGTLLEDVFVLENQTNSINSNMIQDGTIINSKIANNTIRINKIYIQDFDNRYINKQGDIMQGNLNMGGNRIINTQNPINSFDLTTKEYVDYMINKSTIRIEKGEGLVPDSCSSGSRINYQNSFFCSSGTPTKNIQFQKEFKNPPTIIVTLHGPSADSGLLPCTAGAMDQIYLSFDSVTNTSFRAFASMSPYGGNCGGWANYRGPIKFSWYAFGN